MTSVTLLSDTGTELDAVGSKFEGDGAKGGDGLHTVGIYLEDFIGRIFIQGSLAADPTEDDWFNIKLDGESVSYLQYDTEEDGLVFKNFTGNFVWIRAKINRTYITPNPSPSAVGKVTKILMNI